MNDPAGMFQALFDTANDAIFIVDAASGVIVAANAQAVADTGCSAELLRGVRIERWLKRPDAASCGADDCANSFLAELACGGARLAIGRGDSAPVTVSTIAFQLEGAECFVVIASRAHERNVTTRERADRLPEREEFPTIVGQSVKIRDVCRRIGSVAKSDVTVLILGESGTGKEVIANAVHAHSLRGRGPFVKVNCAALTETLLESELFGHVKGAFTGAIRDRLGRFKQADGGTIFLDEIASMSLSGQAKLLRVLQERDFEPVGSSTTIKVNVRVIAATNSDLARAVTDGRFREDLYYRLNVFPILVPPLRERKEDIDLLAHHFLQQHAASLNKKTRALSPDAIEVLVRHGWPGNVRELENAIEHAAIVETAPVITPASLPANLAGAHAAPTAGTARGEPRLRDRLNVMERQILIEALTRANGVKKRAAEMLGVDARNLPYLLRKHHLDEASNPEVSVH